MDHSNNNLFSSSPSPSHSPLNMNPFEQLNLDYQLSLTHIAELERIIVNKDKELLEKNISSQCAIRYITRLEGKIIKLEDANVSNKTN